MHHTVRDLKWDAFASPISPNHSSLFYYIAILLHGHLFLICWLFIGWQLLTVSSPIVGYQHLAGSFSNFLHQIKFSADSQRTVDDLSAICLWHVKKLSIKIWSFLLAFSFIWLWHLHRKENFFWKGPGIHTVWYNKGTEKFYFYVVLPQCLVPKQDPQGKSYKTFGPLWDIKMVILWHQGKLKYINSCFLCRSTIYMYMSTILPGVFIWKVKTHLQTLHLLIPISEHFS